MEVSTSRIYEIFMKSKGITIDSRKLVPGELFFAIKGENFDGHDFIDEVLAKGAIGVVSSSITDSTDERILIVKNTLISLQELAQHHRQKLIHVEVIAVGGSNGKTTTKELIGRVLGTVYNCYVTKGNFNNHIGLPLSVLNLKSSHKFAILEIGANHLEEHSILLEICKPNYVLVTNCGKDHLEGYGSMANVIKSNKEIFDFSERNGALAIVNASDSILLEISEKCKRILYGEAKDYLNPEKVVLGEVINLFPFLNIKITPVEKFVSPSFTVSSHLFGSFQIFNILAAATFGLHFNIGIDDIKSAIESYIPENNRSQIVEWHGNTLILDAYNANPSSMELMLKTFIDSPVEKKLVVLGDMLELGNFQKEEHSNIIELVKSSSSLESIFIGHAFLDANDHEDLLLVGSSNEAIVLLDRFKNKGYTILAKGSRGIAVEKAFELTHNTRINTSVSHPIKYYSQPSDFNSWKTIPIVEENDPMVEISNYDNRIITKPMYFEQGLSGALLNCYTRQSIAKKLKEAASKLPDGIGLCVYDAWRPLEVQQNLFDDYIIHLKSQHLDLNENELIEKAQTFVSLPSANPNKPSPHYTGGSIDLTLVDLATGNELDMGTEFDDFTERAATIYFEDNGGIEHQDIVRNRRLLYHTLCSVGFTNYHAEWWHFDFGNQWWARSLNTIAIYGPININ